MAKSNNDKERRLLEPQHHSSNRYHASRQTNWVPSHSSTPIEVTQIPHASELTYNVEYIARDAPINPIRHITPHNDFEDYVLTLPDWEQHLLLNVHFDYYGPSSTMAYIRESTSPRQSIYAVSDGSMAFDTRSFGWILGTKDGTILARCNGPGHISQSIMAVQNESTIDKLSADRGITMEVDRRNEERWHLHDGDGYENYRDRTGCRCHHWSTGKDAPRTREEAPLCKDQYFQFASRSRAERRRLCKPFHYSRVSPTVQTIPLSAESSLRASGSVSRRMIILSLFTTAHVIAWTRN